MKRNIARATLVIFFVAALWAAMAVPAVAQHFPGIGTVMTYNVTTKEPISCRWWGLKLCNNSCSVSAR
jgi:hypothetical protein